MAADETPAPRAYGRWMAGTVDTPTPSTTRIRKQPRPGAPAPNVADYDAARRAFTWEAARAALDGLPGGRGLNIAHEAVDRHAARRTGRQTALRWLGRQGERVELTYGELAGASTRFANVLDGLGVARGERVFALARGASSSTSPPRHAQAPQRVLAAVLGVRARADPRAAGARRRARARHHPDALPAQGRADPRRSCPSLEHVLLDRRRPTMPASARGRATCNAAAGRRVRATTRSRRPTREDLALLHFTSGTTGTPKGAVHVHEAVVAHHATGALALDLHPDDVFWCTADPGWVTGTSYGIIAPLTARRDHRRRRGGVRRRPLVPRSSQDERVTRLVHRADRAPHADAGRRRAAARARPLARCASSPASASRSTRRPCVWGQEALGPADPRQLVADRDRRDHDRQLRGDGHPARLDGPPAARHRGRHRCGATTTAAWCDAAVEVPDAARRASWRCGRAGRRCSAATSTTTSATGRCFAGGWYLTGDLARRDADGYFWFVGRADDVIKSAGHLIGPVRGRERADGAPGGRRGGRDRQARPGGRARSSRRSSCSSRGHEPSRRAAPRAARLRPARGWARRSRPRRSRSPTRCRTRAAARSCAGCCKARELGLPEGDISTLEEQP